MKYFLHSSDSFDDDKIISLYINFGYEGLGLFYTMLEKFAKAEKPINTIALKHSLNVGKRLNKCWNFMESLGIICSSNGETFNKQLLNFSESYTIKKEKNRERIRQWRESHEDTKNVTHYERVSNTPKVKLSKVNKSKVNKSKGNDDAIASPLYKDCIAIYNNFIKEKTGAGAKIDGMQGNAMKEIINFILKQEKVNGSDEQALIAWKFILENFSRVEPFLQKQLKLNQINSNITNILDQIKNGTGKQFTGKKSPAELAAEVQREIAKEYGTNKPG
jgi:hypothetical protein